MKDQSIQVNKRLVSATLLAMGLVAVLLLSFSLDPVQAEPAAKNPQTDLISTAPTTLESQKINPELIKELNTNGQADFFIWMAEKADLSPAYQLTSKEEKGRFVFETLRATAERTQKDLTALLDSQGIEYRSFYIANKILVRGGNQTLLYQVASRPDVIRLTSNDYVHAIDPIIKPDTSLKITSIEPNISFVNADDVWGLGITGQGSVVAGNDTGLDAFHPAIAPHYRGCLNPPICDQWDHNYNWWDATGTYPSAPWDDMGHGTHTTGTMVGDDGGANQIGIAPGAQTIHCKNMDSGGGGYLEWFELCFQWDLAPWDLTGENPDPTKAPDAINNSWGFDGVWEDFRDEVAALQAAGIVVEASAGNEGPGCSTLRSPGSYAEVLTTGSTNHAFTYPGEITGFSSRGPSVSDAGYFPDVLAPGENIRSSIPGGDYQGGWSGTSMSGPHVTGLVGLLWSANPDLRGQVEITNAIIKHTAVPLTGQIGSDCGGNYVNGPNNDWGYGTIDALAAVQFALAYDGSGTLTGFIQDEGGSPIEAATVWASYSPAITFQTTTDAAGLYEMLVYSGTYDMHTMAYGFGMQTVEDVVVISGSTTVQDFTLIALDTHIISGKVRDALAGWPLYAHITVKGDPLDPPSPFNETWTDPQTGSYSLTMSEGFTHTIKVESFTQGYLPYEVTLPPLTEDLTLNLTLEPDLVACSAAGYQLEIEGLAEPFESQQIPPGWEVIDNAGSGVVWSFDDPAGRGNWTGGGGNFAIVDSDWAGEVDIDTELHSPVLDFSTFTTVNLQFSYDFNYYSDEIADVDVSINGGDGPWVNVWSRSFGSDRGPAYSTLDISAFAAGQPEVMIRFHYYNAFWEWWWQVDRFLIGTWTCNLQPGGLVEGNVTDAETGHGLNNATVAGDSGQETQTVQTPLDPALEDGFYTLFSPAGTHVFTATRSGYDPVVSQVDIIPNDTVRLDFSLPYISLWNQAEPIPFGVAYYGSAQCPDQPNSFYVISGAYDWGIATTNVWRYDVEPDIWNALKPILIPEIAPAAVCHAGKIYVVAKQLQVYDIDTDSWTNMGVAPRSLYGSAMGIWDGKLYRVGGSTGDFYIAFDNVDVYDIATKTWVLDGGTPIPVAVFAPAFTQVGQYLYVVGGNGTDSPAHNVNLIQRYDMATNTWEQVDFPSARGMGFALVYNGTQLYAMGGDLDGNDYYEETDMVEALDLATWPDSSWEVFYDPLPYSVIGNSAGFCTEAKTGGEIWSVGGGMVNPDEIFDYNYYRPTSEPCADFFFGDLQPESLAISATRGTVVTYTLSIHNDGTLSDTYDISIDAVWNTTSPAMVGPMAPGESMELLVSVEIPADAYVGDSDIATITASSQGDPSAADEATLTTTAVTEWVEATQQPVPLVANLVQCPEIPGSFYIVGGVLTGNVTSNTLYRYDIAEPGNWVKLENMPSPRRAVAAACDQGKIYAAGGWNNDIYNNLYVYDVMTDKWTIGPQMPDPIFGAAMGAWDGKLYVVGGTEVGAPYYIPVNRVAVYDIIIGEWIADGGKEMPTASSFFGSVQTGPYLYAVGGASGDYEHNVDQTQRYNMATNEWELGPQFTSARGLTALVASGSHLFALGGDLNGGGVFDITDQVESLDLSSWPNGSWLEFYDPLPKSNIYPASTCSEVLADGEIWAVSGGDEFLNPYGTNYYHPIAEPCVSYGVDLPERWEGKAEAGETVTYTLSITNTGVVTDYFTLDVSTTWNIGSLLGGPGPIGPGESMDIVIAVEVPADAMWGDQGVTEITAASISNPSASDTTSITTTVLGYEFEMQSVPPDSQAGYPGDVLNFTLMVSNIGDFVDSYTVTISATWGTITPIGIDPIQPHESSELFVTVEIPQDALNGAWDIATITLTSQADPRVIHEVTLTSTAFWHRTLIPLAFRN